jgi:hypothetical protein
MSDLREPPLVTRERVLEVLDYDPGTGVFTWKVDTGGRIKKGAIAGSTSSNGYRQIRVDLRRYQAHRLAWLAMTGAFPPEEIDHINGVRADNRWANLRAATRSQNCANYIPPRRRNPGLPKGVRPAQRSPGWRVAVKGIYLGVFDTIEEAHEAYCKAARALYGEYAKTS